jgi:hypothetical protein
VTPAARVVGHRGAASSPDRRRLLVGALAVGIVGIGPATASSLGSRRAPASCSAASSAAVLLGRVLLGRIAPLGVGAVARCPALGRGPPALQLPHEIVEQVTHHERV